LECICMKDQILFNTLLQRAGPVHSNNCQPF